MSQSPLRPFVPTSRHEQDDHQDYAHHGRDRDPAPLEQHLNECVADRLSPQHALAYRRR
jgi:hypothetical protein